MPEPVYFTVVADYKAFIEDATTDSDYNPQEVPVGGTVTFTPLVNTGDVVRALNASPRPVGYIPAPVTAIIDPADGRLKMRKTADTGGTGTFADVRLLGTSDLLELSGPLFYRVAFTEIVYANNRRGNITGFTFEAPSADVEVNLISVGRAAGQTAANITKIAPGGVRLDDGEIWFTFGGIDIPDPIPTSVFAGATGATGATGSAATIDVGNVSTLNPGATAGVRNVGTANAAVLEFDIPRGDTGPAGIQGPVGAQGIQGQAGVSLDINGTLANYAAIVTIPSPTAGDAYVNAADGKLYFYDGESWPADGDGVPFVGPQGPVGAQGVAGPVGDTGSVGATGATGAAATIEVGTVTTGFGGTASVTNSGTSSSAVFDFVIPRGDTGAAGPVGATGDTGPAGAQGVAAANILGVVATYADLPPSGSEKDAYVVAQDGLLYIRSASTWPDDGDGVPWVGPAGSSVSQLIGDGTSTSITVTHGLGTRAITVAVYDATTWAEVECDVVATSNNAVTLTFATAPGVNALSVSVISGGSTSWAGITDKPTSDAITEGATNLYYSDARADARIALATAASAARLLAPTAYVAGNYYYANPAQASSTNANLGNGTVRVSPWVVTTEVTVTAFFIEYTAAGQSGSVFRVGVWADNGSGLPSTLVRDAGTIATDGTPAVVEVVMGTALTLTPGLYWIGGAVQNAASTQPTIRQVAQTISAGGPLGTSLPFAGGALGAYTKGSVTGAFGDLSGLSFSSAAPRIGFKVSA